MSTLLQRQIETLLQKDPPRAKSLCMTVLGDAIYPHGGRLWLADLIKLVQPFGVNERLLRTSIFRLLSQNWLCSERTGRRSLYGFSTLGLELTLAAAQRVYDGDQTEWNGDWTVVISPRFGNVGMPGMADLRHELIWAGFGQVAPGVFVLPSDQTATARKILSKLGLADKILVIASRDLNGNHGLSLIDLAGKCWNLEFVSNLYQKFEADFRPVLTALSAEVDPRLAFTLRTLAVHNWRRVVLHDPQLPRQMLPSTWPGLAARNLCGQIYWKVFESSERYLQQMLGHDPEHFGPLNPSVRTRFGHGTPLASAAE